MGNIIASNSNITASNLQSDGSFAGTGHTISSSVTNITSTGVNFTGANQTITLSGTGKTINFGSTTDTSATINYYNVPTFNNSTGGYFKIGSTQFIDSSGKITSSFMPTISTLGTLTNVNTTTLTATGSITGANFYTSTGGSFNGPLIGSVTGNVAGDVTGNIILSTATTSITGPGFINVTGGITGANLYSSGTAYFKDLSVNSTGPVNLFSNHTGAFNIGNSSNTNNIRMQQKLTLIDGKIVESDHFTTSGYTRTLALGNDITTANINMGGALTSGNINIGNASGTGSINLNQNITTAKTLTSTSDISGKSISSSTTSFASGGGLKIGTNKWTIAENSAGNLCFYNNNGIAGTGTVPYACIQGGAAGTAGVGNLITGTT